MDTKEIIQDAVPFEVTEQTKKHLKPYNKRITTINEERSMLFTSNEKST